ncbi:hypothetical protein D9M68_770350 [compost metagenome]
MNCAPGVTGETPMETLPSITPLRVSISSRARRTSSRISRARRTRRSPYSVRVMPRLERTSSGTPSSASSSLMPLDRAGWEIWSSREASWMLPLSQIATMARSWCNFMNGPGWLESGPTLRQEVGLVL